MRSFFRIPRGKMVAGAAVLALASSPLSITATAVETGTQVEQDDPTVQLVIESRGLIDDGAQFGDAGSYEVLRGHVLGELDPNDPANAGIVNLDKAPVNDDGNVDYRVGIEIHKPVEMDRGNGTLLYEVVNRGRKLIPGFVHGDTSLLYNEGFTLVWSGWQGDIEGSETALAGQFPIATNNGEPIVDLVRDEFVDRGTDTWTGTLSYPAATLDRTQATLTVREREQDARQPIDTWHYVNERGIEVTHPGAPFDSGAIFEFIYPGTDPIVLGMGFAATRDVTSYLRFGDEDAGGSVNPLGDGMIDNAIAMGISQSGRFLRDFLYQGFNESLNGQQIFDGAMPIIAGSRKVWLNYEFAQPGRWSKQHEDHLQRGDQFPFAYNIIEDPVTGQTDGIFAECRATETCPKVMHVDGEFEVWGARGSLLVTDGDPERPKDLKIPSDVRLYMVAGTPHGGANTIVPGSSERGMCQQVNTPLGTRAVIRSLLLRLDSWSADGVAPPKTSYGSANAQTLVNSDQASTRFPAIPGVTYNGLFNYLHVTDYTRMPPSEGAEYGVLVPRVDAIGNSLAGIRLPAIEAPIATYTGWNLRAAGHAEGEMCGSAGSFVPLPETESERRDTDDPRKSIEELYRSHGDYVKQFSKAAQKLVRQGYLLPADAAAMISEANSLPVG